MGERPVSTYITAVPAYGRDYKSAAAVKADWIAGKDFQLMPSGAYVNIGDKPAGVILSVRYARLTKVVMIP
jgi:hypothetical protein